MKARPIKTNCYNEATFRICLNACVANARAERTDWIEVRDSDVRPHGGLGPECHLNLYGAADNVPVLHGTARYPAFAGDEYVVLPTPNYIRELEGDRHVLLRMIRALDVATTGAMWRALSQCDDAESVRALELLDEARS